MTYSHSFRRILFSWILFFTFISIALAGETVNLLVPPKAAPQIRHGVEVLTQKLQAAGFNVTQNGHSQNLVTIRVVDTRSSEGKKLASRWNLHFSKGESFALRIRKKTIFVLGSDPVGTMYGTYDVAEQVSWGAPNEKLLHRVHPKSETPFVKIRAVNPFLHTQALWNKASWFYSLDFWTKYLDQLSFNRFNLLDIHGVYDVYNTNFFNLFTYFVKSDRFPEIGSPPQECRRNVAMLNKIIAMAEERGIHVGIMNYSLDSRPGQIRPGRFRGDPHILRPKLRGKDLELYIREVTAKFLKAVPGLWTFGFRIGESGKRGGFFRDTYVAGIKDAGRTDMHLYTRSWLTTRKTVDSLASCYPGRFFVEIKYNGEHMGAPYHAITGRRPWHLSYSYENYTDRPQNYQIIWQVRFNGTHRIFRWGDPEFVRRTVETLHFGNGVGFTIEPMEAYFPWTDFYHNTERVDHHFFDWGFQRNWFWNLLWGRLSYNPHEDARVWMKAFERRFGKVGAQDVEDLVATSSKVIPLVYQAHCLGVDHRADAPEYEVGNGAFRWVETRVDLGIDGFLPVTALDSTAYSGVREFVTEQLSGKVSGRHSPLEVSRRLKRLANHIFTTIRKANTEVDLNNKEYECTRMDAEALADLALYYSEKFLAAVQLEYFKQTGDWGTLKPAIRHAQRAYDYWKDLAKITAIHYHPIVEELRMRTNDYTWAAQLPILKSDIQTLRDELYWLAQANANYKGPLKIGHLPVFRTKPGEVLRITASLKFWKGGLKHAPRGRVWVFFRRQGEKTYQQIELRRFYPNITFLATLPAKLTQNTSHVEYYLKAVARGHTCFWPQNAPEHPFVVDVTQDDTPPTIRYTFRGVKIPASHFTVEATIWDASGVKSAKVYYKELPSYAPWKALPMKKVGKNLYRATVPLTFHGALFHLEAIDVHNNGTKFPDTWKARPYFVIEAWNPATGKR